MNFHWDVTLSIPEIVDAAWHLCYLCLHVILRTFNVVLLEMEASCQEHFKMMSSNHFDRVYTTNGIWSFPLICNKQILHTTSLHFIAYIIYCCPTKEINYYMHVGILCIITYIIQIYSGITTGGVLSGELLYENFMKQSVGKCNWINF